jgi:hypothetical protein
VTFSGVRLNFEEQAKHLVLAVGREKCRYRFDACYLGYELKIHLFNYYVHRQLWSRLQTLHERTHNPKIPFHYFLIF